jgi:hypothetical protein
MAEGAALLVDHVLPAVGHRQWVLSFSGPLAVRLGYDEALLAKVAESVARAAMQDVRGSVKEHHVLGSVEPLHAGVFTVVQRFRADLGLYVHLHCLITDGAFEERLCRYMLRPPFAHDAVTSSCLDSQPSRQNRPPDCRPASGQFPRLTAPSSWEDGQ